MNTPDIHLILRTGKPLDDALRKTLFVMAQYMLEIEAIHLPFKVTNRGFEAEMLTEHKKGCSDDARGTIFRTYLRYKSGEAVEVLFLAERHPNWRELHIEKWETIEDPGLFSTAATDVWKN